MILFSALELEHRIFMLEEIRIVIRCASNTKFRPYKFKRKAAKNMTIDSWINTRLGPILGDYEVEIITGDGSVCPLHKTLERVRNSYVLK